MITFNSLNEYTNIAHFCTSREGGVGMGNYASYNLSPFTGDNPDSLSENKSRLCKELGIDADQLIIPFQTHGTEIREIDNSFLQLSALEKNQSLQGVDGLYTQLSSICVGVTTADCVPLLFYDPQKQVIAVAHAGWRGTCSRIAEMTVKRLVERFDCSPSDILVVIGPSISVQMYEVGKEVVENFETAGFDISEITIIKNQSVYLDLWKANQLSLEKAGILPEHIEVSGICTYTEHERFFSARRLGIKSGRMLSGIMVIG